MKTKEAMQQLALMGFTCDEEPIYTKGTKDDDATEHGSIEELGKNKKTESMPLEKDPTLAQDDKFGTVMKEFYEGKLKSGSGEKVTDPQQAKAIAYSETKDSALEELELRLAQLQHERNVDESVMGYKPDKRKEALIEQLKKQIKELKEKRRTQDSAEMLKLMGVM